MSDVDRLESELEIAKLAETLENARDAMHADRSAETLAAYKAACNDVAAARSSFRSTYRVEAGPGDAAPAVDTINVTAGVKE